MRLKYKTFLEAAQLIDDNQEHYSCCAICEALGNYVDNKEEKFYQNLFDVRRGDTFLERFKKLTKKGINNNLSLYHEKQLQEVRVLCLLFAYHAAKP